MTIILRAKISVSVIIVLSAVLMGGLINLGARLAFAESGQASIQLKKNNSTGLFNLAIRDPQGVKEFSMVPTGKFPYGGVIGGCPRAHILDNALFEDPADFTPEMPATVTDCSGNITEFVIPTPQKGTTVGRVKIKEEPQEEAAPLPAVKEAVKAAPSAVSLSSSAPSAGAGSASASASEEASAGIVYPVPELGNCSDEKNCKAYCDEPDNIKACLDFAEEHGLASDEEVRRGKRFLAAGGRGPGGCRGEKECHAYCEDSDRIEECLAFGKKYQLISEEEIAEAEKMLPLIKSGKTPGGCKSKVACEAYCEKSENIEMCLAFAEENNLLPAEELAQAKKFLPLIKSGKTPGACKSKTECDNYCANPDNMRSCLAFAEEQGIIPEEELEMAKKFLPLMEKGETPGGCRSKDQCEAYCADSSHQDECFSFAEKAGFIGPEEKRMMEVAKKFGCRSQGECEAICRDPQSEQCQELMREMGIESQFGPPPGLDDDFGGGPGGFGGPGGCKSREECEAFCRDNPEECQQFRPSPGGMGDFGEFEDRAAREEFFEGVRSEHVENVKRDSPEILRCLEEKVGSEVFGRRQAGRIADEAEGRLVKETLLACGAAVGSDRVPSPEDLEKIKAQQTEEFRRQYEEQYRERSEEEFKRQYEEQMRQFQGQAPGGFPPNSVPPEYQQYLPQ